MSAAEWADAIGVTLDEAGAPLQSDIATQIRSAILATGTLRRGQITRGLNEAYAPFNLTESVIRSSIDQVLDDLVLIGDLTELKTASGAAFILTPPRLVVIDEERAALLGASAHEGGGGSIARQLAPDDWPSGEATLRTYLRDELGLPDWRVGLVKAGGLDAPLGTAETLFAHLVRLSAGGERLEILTPDKVRVLAGSQSYFGRYDAPQLEGRWHAATADGDFCAARHVGHGWRQCMLSVRAGRASIWEGDDPDLWRWAVVGQTLASGASLYRYDPEAGEFAMHVPPPRQVRRLLALGAMSVGPWRWRAGQSVVTAAGELLAGGAY